MVTINPYLNFNGNTEEAFNFYKSVFGGEFITLVRFKDIPEADKIPAGEKEKIMHVSLPIGQGNVLMGTDALESMGHTLTVGNNFYISINTESEKEAARLFNGLSAGGQVTMPLHKAFWGAYFWNVYRQVWNSMDSKLRLQSTEISRRRIKTYSQHGF